jgi:copper homeostasis protein
MQVEICVDSVEGALAAQAGGAHRVELCANLLEGGTTPSAGAIAVARRHLRIGLHVMIRPRGADFLYSAQEVEVMREDIGTAKALGADGVVFGCLTAAGDIDGVLTRELVQFAAPLKVTFHRAFDVSRDPVAGLETLVQTGVHRLLTSGQEDTCLAGMELIGEMQRRAAGRIIIMPGGGLNERNVRRIVAATGVTEVHLSARRTVQSGMDYRNERVYMGGVFRPPEYAWKTTDAEAVARLMRQLP